MPLKSGGSSSYLDGDPTTTGRSGTRVGTTVPKKTRFEISETKLERASKQQDVLSGHHRKSWANDMLSTSSALLNVRKASMTGGFNDLAEPSEFQDTYSQLDFIIGECQDAVPNLIGKLRETRKTKGGVVLPKGYRTKEIIGKRAADSWKD